MAITDETGASVPIMKPTRWLSSSIQMLRRLSSKCRNEHKHGSLLNGKAAGAAIYPQKLCVDILKGIRDTQIEEDLEKEMEDESKSQHIINSLVHDRHLLGGCITSEVVAPRGDDERCGAPKPGLKGSELKGIIASVNSSRREDGQKYFDEVTHVELPAKLVKEARAEELEYFNTLPVWKVVKTQEC